MSHPSGPNESLPPIGDVAQATDDLLMLAGLAEYLGDPQQASNVVVSATGIYEYSKPEGKLLAGLAEKYPGRLLEVFARLDTAESTEQFLGIVGIAGADFNGMEFVATPTRDEARAAQLIQVSKVMDPGYKSFVALNPGFVNDPYITAELMGVPLNTFIQDPDLLERYQKLMDFKGKLQ